MPEEQTSTRDFQKAIENYREAIQRGDRRPATRFNLAVAYSEIGKTAEAKEILNKILQEMQSFQKSDDSVDAELVRSYLAFISSSIDSQTVDLQT